MQTKTIGLLGGIGWASTAQYYRILNAMTAERMGDAHSARLVVLSMNQFDFTSRAGEATPHAIEQFLIEQTQRLKAAGADFFLLCANGAHRFAPTVVAQAALPFISIVDETAKRVQASGLRKVALLGVRQTMSGTFYHAALAARGIDIVTPDAGDQDKLHEIIYAELVHHRITAASRRVFQQIIGKLAAAGAQGVILGCTEIPLLISQADVDIPVFDTTAIHCEAAHAHAFAP
ncbi:aspartate/glutamate racemase family protein [Massilia sp. TWP1-3-3]|uniref:aspartate/glutamate racemase family protein n=1 Tax=Massilia sp. TWP1-3-3 TaxID=2804573 RepID=UPI003CF49EC5